MATSGRGQGQSCFAFQDFMDILRTTVTIPKVVIMLNYLGLFGLQVTEPQLKIYLKIKRVTDWLMKSKEDKQS